MLMSHGYYVLNVTSVSASDHDGDEARDGDDWRGWIPSSTDNHPELIINLESVFIKPEKDRNMLTFFKRNFMSFLTYCRSKYLVAKFSFLIFLNFCPWFVTIQAFVEISEPSWFFEIFLISSTYQGVQWLTLVNEFKASSSTKTDFCEQPCNIVCSFLFPFDYTITDCTFDYKGNNCDFLWVECAQEWTTL